MAQSVIELFIYTTLKLSKVPEIADKQNIFWRKSHEWLSLMQEGFQWHIILASVSCVRVKHCKK